VVFQDSSQESVGFLGILQCLGELALYSTMSVITFFTIKGLLNPNGPPCFSLRVVGWVPTTRKSR
jgi:hypothetical protein